MPWFKNTIVYAFNKQTHYNKKELETALSVNRFSPCGTQDFSKVGWVSPYGDQNENLVVEINDHLLIKAKKETKLLPPSVINDALKSKINAIQATEQRELKKKEKRVLKEDVVMDLLPRAFSKYHYVLLWIDLKHQRVILDATSFKQAESIISLLRNALGSMPLVPSGQAIPLEVSLTNWVKNNPSFPPFCLGDEAELKDPLNGLGIIRCRQQELTCDEIMHHINAGKQITKLKVIEENCINFIMQNDLTLKRIKYAPDLIDKNQDIDTKDTEKRLEADFMIMSEVISRAVNQINEIIATLSIK